MGKELFNDISFNNLIFNDFLRRQAEKIREAPQNYLNTVHP